MKINFYNKYKIRFLQKCLQKTEEKIEVLMNTSTSGTIARSKLEKDLIKHYKDYSYYAMEYVDRQVKVLQDSDYVRTRLVYAGWKQATGLLDSVYMRVGLKNESDK